MWQDCRQRDASAVAGIESAQQFSLSLLQFRERELSASHICLLRGSSQSVCLRIAFECHFGVIRVILSLSLTLDLGTRTIALPNAWLVTLRGIPAQFADATPACSFRWKFATRDVEAPPSQTPFAASMSVTLGLSGLPVTSRIQRRKDVNAPQCCRHPNVQASQASAPDAEQCCQPGWLSGLACACIALAPASANAYNVRLEDVENPALQSGKLTNITAHQRTKFSC